MPRPFRLPAIHGEFAVNAALELQRLLGADGFAGASVFVSFGVGHIGQRVIPNHRAVAFLASEERSRLPLALDAVALDRDRLEVTSGVEPEQSVRARRGGGARDNVVVADFQIVEDLLGSTLKCDMS